MERSARLRSSLVALLDIGTDPDEEPDLRTRKRTAVASALVFVVVGTAVGLTDIVIGLYLQAVLAALQVIAFSVALLVYSRSHRIAPLVVTMVAVGVSVLFLSLIPSGGMNWGALNLAWIILVPPAVVLFLGARGALPALIVVVAVVILAVLMDPLLLKPAPEPSLGRIVIEAVTLIGTAASALLLVVFIDGERVRAKAESESLLLNVLPHSIAERLKSGESVIADRHDEVTVLFADLVEFTPRAAQHDPAEIVVLLNAIFSRFDALAEQHGLEKIKTIGDAYMVVAGAPKARPDHAEVIIEMAIAMFAVCEEIEPQIGQPLQIRMGVASGPAVAGVIGTRKFSYDVWGHAVNLASRMESTGLPDMVQVSESTWRHCAHRYRMTPREVEVKGLGTLTTYLLDPRSAHG